MELSVFFLLVFMKAFHPVVIDASKTGILETESVMPHDMDLPPPVAKRAGKEDKGNVLHMLLHHGHPDDTDQQDVEVLRRVYLYKTASVIVAKDVLIAIIGLVICLVVGGFKQFRSIWEPRPFLVFTINGFIYALGDCLEMASLGALSGGVYQMLMQSQVCFTALIVMCAKGVFQTRLQWMLLTILMMGMTAYMMLLSGGDARGDVPILGVVFALLRVAESCIAAVISDKYTKVYKGDPTHVQVTRIYILRPFYIFGMSVIIGTWPGFAPSEFFVGWDLITLGVSMSFAVKALATLYVLALLDSILKNIAESFAVVVIYAYDVLALGKEFDAATFLCVLVVVAACCSYVESKLVAEKAVKYDKEILGKIP